MSLGLVLLTAVAVLVFFGVIQRVLDKMHLTDREALVITALMFFGTLIPNLSLGRVEINLGGGLIPVGVCIYLLFKADEGREVVRTLAGAALTAAAVYLLGRWMPDEPEAISFDPNYVYGLIGGLIAYLLGRSRRGAFICGVMGILLADTAVAWMNWQSGLNQPLILGGGGVMDAMVISGVLAVLLAEGVGELTERMTRGAKSPAERPIATPVKHQRGGNS